jgi:hypothetical protein
MADESRWDCLDDEMDWNSLQSYFLGVVESKMGMSGNNARRPQLIKQVFDEAQQRDGHDRVEKWYHYPWHHHL